MHRIAKRKKTYPGECKDKQLRRSRQEKSKFGKRKQAGHVFKKNLLSVAAKVLRMLREGKKGVFDMGKVSRSFQDYFLTGAGDTTKRQFLLQGNTKQTH